MTLRRKTFWRTTLHRRYDYEYGHWYNGRMPEGKCRSNPNIHCYGLCKVCWNRGGAIEKVSSPYQTRLLSAAANINNCITIIYHIVIYYLWWKTPEYCRCPQRLQRWSSLRQCWLTSTGPPSPVRSEWGAMLAVSISSLCGLSSSIILNWKCTLNKEWFFFLDRFF